MKAIHIVGRRNHGKTTLIVDLIRELVGRGLRVGAVKHSSHRHELDVPGKDSFRHRTAGAVPAAVIAENMVGVYLPRADDADPYAQIAPLFNRCDLVLVEGHFDISGIKIEVWRKAVGPAPLASEHEDIAALVTDDPVEANIPVWPRGDVPQLAEKILALAESGKHRSAGKDS